MWYAELVGALALDNFGACADRQAVEVLLNKQLTDNLL